MSEENKDTSPSAPSKSDKATEPELVYDHLRRYRLQDLVRRFALPYIAGGLIGWLLRLIYPIDFPLLSRLIDIWFFGILLYIILKLPRIRFLTTSGGIRVEKGFGPNLKTAAPAIWKFVQLLMPILITLGVVYLLWEFPRWQVASLMDVPADKEFTLENEARRTIAQILGGTVVLIGLYFTWRTIHISQEGQLTQRFNQAIEQLGNDTLRVRLGGIYSLGRIERDSKKDSLAVMDVLSSYLYEKSPWTSTSSPDFGPLPLDIQAVLSVIARRPKRIFGRPLRLAYLDLRRGDLSDAYLSRAIFVGSHLEYIILAGADLSHALFAEVHLEYARLDKARLWHAWLNDAHLEYASLVDADLEGASLQGTHLEGADLTGVIGLTVKQINSAIINNETKLPSYLVRVSSPDKEKTSQSQGKS